VGEIQSERAVDSLVAMLNNPLQQNNLFLIYGALGAIGDTAAIPVLEDGLKGGERYNQIAALSAILRIDPDIGLSFAIAELQDDNEEIRRNAVIVCIQSGDARAIDPLKSVLGDEDFEVRFYAKQGIKRLKKP
jgi:HEAT repeat protein